MPADTIGPWRQQACAYGAAVVMYYDGSFLDVKPLHVHSAVHLVLVDLCGSKDTVQILNGLQAAYPAPSSSVHEGV